MTELQSQLLRLLDEVEAGAELVVLREGRRVARLSPGNATGDTPFKRTEVTAMRDTVKIHGDIIGPFPEEWNKGTYAGEGNECC